MTDANEPPADVLTSQVPDELEGRRADDVVLRSFSGFSRREVKELFEAGSVRVDGRRVKKGDRVRAGAELQVEAKSAPITPDPALSLEILFESDDFVIVNKPAGLPTAPLVRSESRTLAAALLARYPEMAGVGFRAREPGLVHRLDTETSGVVLAARNAAAFDAARAAFDASRIQKRYWAVVSSGLPDSGALETWLGPDPSDPRRVRVYVEAPEVYAKRARTEYRVVERGPEFCLVEVTIASAFRHQVRAHLAALGYPIAGDRVYAGRAVAALGARHALHGAYIAWAGDATRGGFRAEAGLPLELGALVKGGVGA
jgi:23S rRNA pseudouridine1911/1915/1917 synthase